MENPTLGMEKEVDALGRPVERDERGVPYPSAEPAAVGDVSPPPEHYNNFTPAEQAARQRRRFEDLGEAERRDPIGVAETDPQTKNAFLGVPVPGRDATFEQLNAYRIEARRAGFDLTAAEMREFDRERAERHPAQLANRYLDGHAQGDANVMLRAFLAQQPQLMENELFARQTAADLREAMHPEQMADLAPERVTANGDQFGLALYTASTMNPPDPQGGFAHYAEYRDAFREVGVRLTADDFETYREMANGARVPQNAQSLGVRMLNDLSRPPSERTVLNQDANAFAQTLRREQPLERELDRTVAQRDGRLERERAAARAARIDEQTPRGVPAPASERDASGVNRDDGGRTNAEYVSPRDNDYGVTPHPDDVVNGIGVPPTATELARRGYNVRIPVDGIRTDAPGTNEYDPIPADVLSNEYDAIPADVLANEYDAIPADVLANEYDAIPADDSELARRSDDGRLAATRPTDYGNVPQEHEYLQYPGVESQQNDYVFYPGSESQSTRYDVSPHPDGAPEQPQYSNFGPGELPDRRFSDLQAAEKANPIPVARASEAVRNAFLRVPPPRAGASFEQLEQYRQDARNAGYDLKAADIEAFVQRREEYHDAPIVSQALSNRATDSNVMDRAVAVQDPAAADRIQFNMRSGLDRRDETIAGFMEDFTPESVQQKQRNIVGRDATGRPVTEFQQNMHRLGQQPALTTTASFREFDTMREAMRGVGVRLTENDFNAYREIIKEKGVAALQSPATTRDASMGVRVLADLHRSPEMRELVGLDADKFSAKLGELQPVPNELRWQPGQNPAREAQPQGFEIKRNGVSVPMPENYRQSGTVVNVNDDTTTQNIGMRQSVEYKTNDLTTAIDRKELDQAAQRGDNLRISNDHGALQVENLSRQQTQQRQLTLDK